MEHSALSVALLRQRLVSMLRAMPAAQAGDETSVHQARVASRRLREALPVLGARAERTGGRSRRQTRAPHHARTWSGARARRYIVVTRRARRKGAQRRSAPSPASAQAVSEERQKRRRAMLAELTPSRLEKLRKRLVEVAAPTARREATRTAMAEANAQAVARAQKLARRDRSRGGHLPGRPAASRAHRSQEAALRARDSARADCTRARRRVSTALKHQQDLLGRIHDLEVLIERTREVQASLPAPNRRAMSRTRTG